jgi:hypothetical protein
MGDGATVAPSPEGDFMSTRRVIIEINRLTDAPWQEGAKVLIHLSSNSYTSSATYPKDTEVAYLDEEGKAEVVLWCNAEGLKPAEYVCTLPSRESFSFTLPSGEEPVKIEVLRALHSVPLTPTSEEVLGAVVAQYAASEAILRDAGDQRVLDDAKQYTDEHEPDIDLSDYQQTSQRNQPGGYAGLDDDGLVWDEFIPDTIARVSHVTAEASARATADAALTTAVAAKADSSALASEASTRAAADVTLTASVAAAADAAAALASALGTESSARQAADSTLQTNINSEATSRVTGDSLALSNANAYTDTQVAAEATARAAADSLLAPKASPALTGTPTAPTAPTIANSMQVATTAFVQARLAEIIGLAPSTLDTFQEIAAQLVADESGVAALTTTVGGKLSKDANLSDLPDPAAGRVSLGLGTAAVEAASTLLARANHSGTQSADTLTDGTTNKAFTATERTKLAGVATGATANSPDATLLNRGNHSGTQTLATISDAGTSASKNVAASGNAAAGEVVKGNDTRLADARTPTAHASSHASAGSDPVTLAQSQVTNLVSDLAGKEVVANKSTSVSTDAASDTKYPSVKAVANATRGNGYIGMVKAVETIQNRTLSGLQTVDFYSVLNGERVLLLGQDDQTQNGVWVVHAGAWTRPADFATGSVHPSGALIYVSEGAQMKSCWMQLDNAVDDSITFTVDTDLLNSLSRQPPDIGETEREQGPVLDMFTWGRTDVTSLIGRGKARAQSPIDFGGQRLANAPDPTVAQDLATKNYVDTHTVTATRGGTGIDSSALTGVPYVSAGVWAAGTGFKFDGANLSINLGSVAAPTKFVVGDSASTTPRGLMSWQSSSDAASAHLHMRKSRGPFSAPTTIVVADVLGRIVFAGYEGTNYIESAYIRAVSVGTIATNRVPSKLEIYTSTNAAPSVATLAVTIDESQNLAVAGLLKAGSTPTTLTDAAGKILSAALNTVAAAQGGFGADVSAAAGVPLFAAGVPTFTGTSGTGNFARVTSPSFVTPTLGVASATSINKVAITAPATGATLAIAEGKTLTVSNSITIAGTDAMVMTFPSTSATIARTDAGQVFTGQNTFTSPKVLTDISDTNGNELIKVTATTSAVNEITVANAATAGRPTITASGNDTNIGLTIQSKGTGTVRITDTSGSTLFEVNRAAGRVEAPGFYTRTSDGAALTDSSGLTIGGTLSNQIRFTVDGTWFGTTDTGIKRNTAGVVEINNATAGAFRDMLLRGLRCAETATDPVAADLTSGANAEDRFQIYMKNDKLVVAYNRSGTVTYLTVPLDGATAAWTQSTTAP